MKKLTLAEWEKKNIVGTIEPFDQKYIMFFRPDWDADLKRQMEDWSFSSGVQNSPGRGLEEIALIKSTGPVTRMFSLFNAMKPNPSRPTKRRVI
jgi:hypothetical protein